jgi:hypothetical protein
LGGCLVTVGGLLFSCCLQKKENKVGALKTPDRQTGRAFPFFSESKEPPAKSDDRNAYIRELSSTEIVKQVSMQHQTTMLKNASLLKSN